LAASISDALAQFREDRAKMASSPGLVDDVLADGAERAGKIVRETMTEVRQRMNICPTK
ncbi:hypothetical protein LCGC14_2952270, partial [marine sediment metagenome]